MYEAKKAPPLRLWPGVLIVVVQWLAVFGTGLVAPASAIQFFGMMGGPALALVLFFGWWLLGSRAPWRDRLIGAFLPLVVFGGAFAVLDPSAPMALFIYGVPLLCLLFVLCVAVTRHWPTRRRWVAMAVTIVAVGGVWPLVRTEGVDGSMSIDLAWRWRATAEERFLASHASTGRLARRPEDAVAAGAVWPAFRGSHRDSVVRGVRIATDWRASPPTEIWRRPVGPGWGSFSLAGDVLYTQEQRGDDEVVASYRASTGEPVWVHRDTARFWEALAGAGPRATPTLADGRVYTLGATGILNALDAGEGTRLWRRDLVADTRAPVPDWGFSSSPLVVDGLVVVHAGGPDGKGVVAYDALTGVPRWFAPTEGLSYSSPHLTTLDGARQLVMLTGAGVSGLAPADGSVLWHHAWPMPGGGARIVQPAFDGGTVLVGTGFGMGVRRIDVSRSAAGWGVEEGWTSNRLKPYYNDLVVHDGHVYGFDGRILACLDLATGERRWKGGRYGYGQLVLLADQDLLLVLSDRGEVALVEARPDAFTEVAKMPVIEGKTWNHPVIADGVLYVRNGEEMAAFRLPEGSEAATAAIGR